MHHYEKCVIEINNTQVDNAQDMYNLLEYSDIQKHWKFYIKILEIKQFLLLVVLTIMVLILSKLKKNNRRGR